MPLTTPSVSYSLQGPFSQCEASLTLVSSLSDKCSQSNRLSTRGKQEATFRQVAQRGGPLRQPARHVLPLTRASAEALVEPSWKVGGGDDVSLSEDEAELADKPQRRDESEVTKGRVRARGGRKTQANSEIEGSSPPRLEWLKQEGVDLTTERTLWRVNRAISRCSSVGEALRVVEEMKARGINVANEGTYVALITVCRRQRQGERALVVYEAMKEAGVTPGLLTMNALLSCCQQGGRLEDAFRIKGDMERAGLKPDVVSYSSLMALVVKTGPYRGRSSPSQRLSRALELFSEMESRGVAPDSVTFNTLLYAGAEAKLPGKVLEIYGMMSAARVPPSAFTFQVLLPCVGQSGRLGAALEVFHEMKAQGVAPSTSTFDFLIEACGTAAQPDSKKAWQLHEEMEGTRGVKPGAETYNHLITASCKGNDHPGALKAFDLMVTKGFSKNVSASTFNKLIHSASTSEGLPAAMEMYGKMRESGLSPDVVTAGTLMSACSRAGNLEKALEVREEMEGMGVRSNQE